MKISHNLLLKTFQHYSEGLGRKLVVMLTHQLSIPMYIYTYNYMYVCVSVFMT